MPAKVRTMLSPMKCETCPAVFCLSAPTDIDRSFAELGAAGWMHFARKGVGRPRWSWKCPRCKPQGSPKTMGLTTGHLK